MKKIQINNLISRVLQRMRLFVMSFRKGARKFNIVIMSAAKKAWKILKGIYKVLKGIKEVVELFFFIILVISAIYDWSGIINFINRLADICR